ncbi:MAG: hypothetical protein ACRDLP_14965 [Solirubrobacteraceae bacterium]
MRQHKWMRPRHLLALGAVALLAVAGTALAAGAFIAPLNTVTTITSTVPTNGDVNPYGIVVVGHSQGGLVQGDVLVSNFNAASNEQGTGTTIVELSPTAAESGPGSAHVFARIDPGSLHGACPGGVGLTTALSVLPNDYVVVGSLPTANGMSSTAGAGCLIVLDPDGHVVKVIAGGAIDGPWDMTSVGDGRITTLFVTNVLAGISEKTADHATVVRIHLETLPGRTPGLIDERVIGTGFDARTDPSALVLGPTGVALAGDTLYVADTLNSRIAAIPDAMDRMHPFHGGGTTVSSGGALNGPLGLALAPNGDILTANAGDGNIVETTPGGMQVATKTGDATTGAGSLFGPVATPQGNGVYFVDDGDNTLRLLH